jgi:hypothetical protein
MTDRLSNTIIFAPTSAIHMTSVYSGATLHESVPQNSATSVEGVVPSAPFAEARAPVEKTQAVGHVFSISLLLVVGMAFWVRSAYVENALVALDLEAIDEEYLGDGQ